MMEGGEMKITELLLAELDREGVGIRKTPEQVPELIARLGRTPSHNLDLARFQPEF